MEKDWPGLGCGFRSSESMRPLYGEGRAEREEVETAGEHVHVGGTDGGNIRECCGECWRVLRLPVVDNGHSGWVVGPGAFDFLGKTTSCLALDQFSWVCLAQVFK